MVAADKLFNSIAKGSTNYFPGLVKKSAEYANKTFDVNLKLKDQDMARKAAKIVTAAGAKVHRRDCGNKSKRGSGQLSFPRR